MEHYDEPPLQVGETVRYYQYGAGKSISASGIIIERLSEDYVRVLWSDIAAPMTHRSHSLVRTESAGQATH